MIVEKGNSMSTCFEQLKGILESNEFKDAFREGK
jgi:hypothetical protein